MYAVCNDHSLCEESWMIVDVYNVSAPELGQLPVPRQLEVAELTVVLTYERQYFSVTPNYCNHTVLYSGTLPAAAEPKRLSAGFHIRNK